MRRLPRLQPLRAIPQTPAIPAPFRALSTTRASPFRNTAARRSDDKQRQEVLEALERDRQSALSLQSEAEIIEEGEEAEIGAGIVIPPDFSYAPAPAATAGDYVPAKSAEGLEEVGGLDGWWDVEGHLTDADRLRVFSQRGEKITDPGVLEVLIRQAVVEGLIVQGKVGGEMLNARWGASGKEGLSRAAGVEVAVSEAGDVTLTGDLSGVLAGLKESAEAQPAQEAAPETETAETEASAEAVAEQAEELLTAEEAKEMIKSWDRAWRKVPITDPSLKFAVRTSLPIPFPFDISGSCLTNIPNTDPQARLPAHRPPPRRLQARPPPHGPPHPHHPRPPREAPQGPRGDPVPARPRRRPARPTQRKGLRPPRDTHRQGGVGWQVEGH